MNEDESQYNYKNGSDIPYASWLVNPFNKEKIEFNNLADRLRLFASNDIYSWDVNNLTKTQIERFNELFRDIDSFAQKYNNGNINDIYYSLIKQLKGRWAGGTNNFDNLNYFLGNSQFINTNYPDIAIAANSFIAARNNQLLDKQQAENSTLLSTNNNYLNRINRLENDNTSLTSNNNSLNTLVEELKGKINGFEELDKSRQEELAKSAKELTITKYKLKQVEDTLKSIQQSLQSNNIKNQEELNKFRVKTLQQLETTQKEYEKSQNEFNKVLDVNKEELTKANVQIEELKKTIDEQSTKLKSFEDMTWYDYLKTGAGKGLNEMLTSMGQHPWYWAGGAVGVILISLGLYKAAKAWREYRAKKSGDTMNEV